MLCASGMRQGRKNNQGNAHSPSYFGPISSIFDSGHAFLQADAVSRAQCL